MKRCKDCKKGRMRHYQVEDGVSYCPYRLDFGDANDCDEYKRKWWKKWREK